MSVTNPTDDFPNFLVRKKIVTAAQLEAARQLQEQDLGVPDALVRLGYVTADKLARALAEFHGLEYRDPAQVTVAAGVLELVPESVAHECVALPLGVDGDALRLLVSEPSGETLDKLRFILNREIRLVVGPREPLEKAIIRHYGPPRRMDSPAPPPFVPGGPAPERPPKPDAASLLAEFLGRPIGGAGQPECPISDTDAVNQIIGLFQHALHLRADAVALVPSRDGHRLRFQVESMWVERDTIHRYIVPALITVLQFMAGLPLKKPGKKGRTQTRRIRGHVSGIPMDFELTIQPTAQGPAIHVRMLGLAKEMTASAPAASRWTWDRVVAAAAAGWVLLLFLAAPVRANGLALAVTGAWLAGNFALSLGVLLRRGRALVLLNLAQLGLFAALFAQVYSALGSQHYQSAHVPEVEDWVELTAVHTLRAADVVDFLEAYRIELQNVRHASSLSGVLLVVMHLAVDIFLLGFLVGVIVGVWRKRGRDRKDAEAWRLRIEMISLMGLVACLIVYLALAGTEGWRAHDWWAWPADNVLRVLDLGDLFQIFHWRLDTVPHNAGMATLAVAFRMFAGFFVITYVNGWWLQYSRGRGQTVEDLVELLTEGDAEGRAVAADALAQLGAEAVPLLVEALQDREEEVRKAALTVLGRLGPQAEAAVPAVVLALGDYMLSNQVIGVLGKIGPAAKVAVPALAQRLDDRHGYGIDDVAEALGEIGPAARETVPALVRALTKNTSWSGPRKAAVALSKIAPEVTAGIPILVKGLTDGIVGADRKEAVEALGRHGPAARESVTALIDLHVQADATLRPVIADALRRIDPNALRPPVPEPIAAADLSMTCTNCQKRLRVKASLAGKRIHCPSCRHTLTVPDGTS